MKILITVALVSLSLLHFLPGKARAGTRKVLFGVHDPGFGLSKNILTHTTKWYIREIKFLPTFRPKGGRNAIEPASI